jgi:hypothetical protein
VLDRTATWHPDLRELFRLTNPSTCLPINIRTSEPVAPWPTSSVTLVGDAIHTMTPGPGVGANTALRNDDHPVVGLRHQFRSQRRLWEDRIWMARRSVIASFGALSLARSAICLGDSPMSW